MINSQEAAELCDVPVGVFRTYRAKIGAPDPVINIRNRDERGVITGSTVMYSKSQYIDWTANNNFNDLAYHYRRSKAGYKTIKRKQIRTEVNLMRDLMRDFIIGKFAPRRNNETI